MHLDVAMRTLRRNGVWAALVVVLALATGWAVLRLVPPTWTAEVRVLYAVTGLTAVDQGVPAGALAAARAAQDAELVPSPVVLQPVIDELGLDITAKELGTAVQGTATSTFLDVEVALGDPEVAARVADSLVAQLVLRAADDQLTPVAASPDAPVVTLDLAVVRPAVVPERPSWPDPLLTMAGALLVGLFLAAALLTWRARTDDVVDDEHDLARATDAPVLARVRVPAGTLADAVTQPSPDVAGLRTALLARTGDRAHTAVAVVACTREPALQVAAALARAYAGTGRDTLLVEGDLATARLATALGLATGGPGLAQLLTGSAAVVEAAHASDVPALRVVAAGADEGERTDVVASRQAEKAWDDVRTSAEVVVLATGAADVGAAVLAAACDEVVLLAAPGRTRRDEVRSAVHTLEAAGAAPSGVVWVL